jgi:signal transduction histidine kinase
VNEPASTIDQALADPFRLPMTSSPPHREVTFEDSGGRRRHVALSEAVLRDQRQAPVGRVWVLHDLTEQRLAEAQKNELEVWVQHGQKLETLGVMAGGIAHDFNNLLTAILGSAELMLAAVTKKASLEFEFVDDSLTVIADRVQLTQVVLNLITNASDSLDEHGGTITVRTGLPAAEGGALASTAPMAFIAVADTGMGMDQETRDRVFDPFFTTKFTGRGLGLATVAGPRSPSSCRLPRGSRTIPLPPGSTSPRGRGAEPSFSSTTNMR